LYDVGFKKTLDNLESYIKEASDLGVKDITTFLVGNKVFQKY